MTDAVLLFLSKTLDLLVAPLTWAIALAAVAALLRRPRLSPTLAGLSAALLWAFSTDAVALALHRRLEAPAVSTFRPEPPYDALVVLTGMVDTPASAASGETELTGEADRIIRAALLLRAGAARDVLLTGGLVDPHPGDVPEAERLAALLRGLGIAPERIVVEPASRNTHESALASARVVAARGWRRIALVTSAAHVPRAVGCFRAAGLDPDVLPVDRRAAAGRRLAWAPRASALRGSTDVLREATGRIAYRLLGWTR